MRAVENERRRRHLEGEISLLAVSSLVWAKPSVKRKRLSTIKREMKALNG